MMTDLAAAREAQMRRKLMAQAAMAEVEQTEFKRVLEVNREKQMQDMSQVGVACLSQSSNAVVTEAWGRPSSKACQVDLLQPEGEIVLVW